MRPFQYAFGMHALPAALLALACGGFGRVTAAPISYSGVISYDGQSQGDSLYVAVLDTAGVEDVTLLDVVVIDVGASPFAQAYTLEFDNASVSSQLLIASFLDVDGGGLSGDISGVDVFGWYDGQSFPAAVSSSVSQSGLDFALPTGEIHGSISFASGQVEARVDVAPDPSCSSEGFRPGTFLFAEGTYSIIGVYAGTYCVSASGFGSFGNRRVCHGDPDCVSPVLISLGDGEVRNGVDLDFSTVPIEDGSWGAFKARYR